MVSSNVLCLKHTDGWPLSLKLIVVFFSIVLSYKTYTSVALLLERLPGMQESGRPVKLHARELSVLQCNEYKAWVKYVALRG